VYIADFLFGGVKRYIVVLIVMDYFNERFIGIK
jgi:hypothetical protein